MINHQTNIDLVVDRCLEMFRSGVDRKDVLKFIANAAEKVYQEEVVSSILLIDEQGLLRNGASPKLPPDYLRAIDGLKPDPNLGTCAAAAATGQIILTPDFCADNKWAELRHLPMELGFTGAWSLPIKNRQGEVIGTFGTYFRSKRLPSEEEVSCIRRLAMAAAEILA